jgi:polar amino acid transport system permease protein
VAEIKKNKIDVSDGALIPSKQEKATFSAWRISFFGAIALLIILPIVKPDPFWDIMKFLPDGILRTFQVTLISIVFALIIGLVAGLGRIAQSVVINRIATVYVEVIRGIPLLVQLFYLYFALGHALTWLGEKVEWFPELRIPRLVAAVIAISICYGAYMAEIFRAGMQSIPKGQMEASLALGMTRGQALRRVIIPQTMRMILPPIGNEFIAMLKDSSLVSILAISDLLRRGREYAATSFRYFGTYTMVALVYLILTLFFSRMVGIMENRLDRRGR